VAFAIPSSLLSVVLPRLKDYHHGMPGRLPLQTQDVSQVLAASLDTPKPGGAAVVALTDQADSLKGKVQPGDIIQSFDGLPVLDPRDLARKAIKTAVGSKVTLGFYRGAEKKEAVVEIVPFADSMPTVRHMQRPTTLGLHLSAREQGTDPAVIIDMIDESGSAADSGLRKNDQILQVDRDVVDTVEGAMAALNARIQAKRGYAAILLRRDKTKQWTALALPD
jgi:S1-C subfamily serine protease